MKKKYQIPHLWSMDVKAEMGFAASDASYGLGTPGGNIDYDEYGNEL